MPARYTTWQPDGKNSSSVDVPISGTAGVVFLDLRTTEADAVIDSLQGSSALVVLDGGAGLGSEVLRRLSERLAQSALRYVWASADQYGQAAATISATIDDGAIGQPVFCRASILRPDAIDTPIGSIVELVSSWMGEAPDRVHLTRLNSGDYRSLFLHFSGGATAVCDLVVAPSPPTDEVYLQGTTGALGWPTPGALELDPLVAGDPYAQPTTRDAFVRDIVSRLADGMPSGESQLANAARVAQAIETSATTGATASVATHEGSR